MSANYDFYSDGLSPALRFCVASDCGRVILPERFQRESDLCDICTAAQIPPCIPFSAPNNNIHGDASHMYTFAPSSESPHGLHGNRLMNLDPWSNYAPFSPTIMPPRHSPIRRIPPSINLQQPQPISYAQTSNTNWMRPNYDTYRTDVFAGTSQRISTRNVPSIADYSTTSFTQEIGPQERQPILSLYCEKCHISIPDHLMGNGIVCSNCLIADRVEKFSVPTKPSLPFSDHDSVKQKHAIDLTSNVDDGSALMTGTANAVKAMSAPPIRLKMLPKKPQQDSPLAQSRPSKRPRIKENAPSKIVDQPIIIKIGTAEGNVSRICSTPSCNRTTFVESCGNRCISCVKLGWKSIKERLNNSGPHQECGARRNLPSALAKSTSTKPRKSVSWSDTVSVAMGDGSVIRHLSREVEKARRSVSDNEQDVEAVGYEVCGVTKIDTVLCTDNRLRPDTRTVVKQEVLLAPPDKPDTSTLGWDSDLSDLTGSDESDSPDDTPQVSTGLKIRIPARPRDTIICPPKCRNVWCNQVLANDHPGNFCMMCRVHHRQKRRRKGLDDEVTILDEMPLQLIWNARLCSANECTHFIPPHEEYKSKRCNLCRLYQKERRLLRQKRPTPQSDSNKPLVDVNKIYDLFTFLPVRFPTPGRCRSLDCGVLHDNGSTLCKQCISRRAKLMKKAGIQEEAGDATAGQDKPLRELDIYPQYRCYAVLLSDFGRRLKAFLKCQAIFFLFKMNQPPLIGTKALFSFDGEYSVVALDLDVVGRKTKIDSGALKTKKDLEGIEGLKFEPRRLISILEGGGVAIRHVSSFNSSASNGPKFNDSDYFRDHETHDR